LISAQVKYIVRTEVLYPKDCAVSVWTKVYEDAVAAREGLVHESFDARMQQNDKLHLALEHDMRNINAAALFLA
jgi:hypothetical protein